MTCAIHDCERYGCNGDCRQGRDCEAAHLASRRVFWLEPEDREDAAVGGTYTAMGLVAIGAWTALAWVLLS